MKKPLIFQLAAICILLCSAFINTFSQCLAEAGEIVNFSPPLNIGDVPISGPYSYDIYFYGNPYVADGATDDIAYFLVGNNNEFLLASSTGIFDLDSLPSGSGTLPNPLTEIGDSVCVYQVIYNKDLLMQVALQANEDLGDIPVFLQFPQDGDLADFANQIRSLMEIMDIISLSELNLPLTLDRLLVLLEGGTISFYYEDLLIGLNSFDLNAPAQCYDISTNPHCWHVACNPKAENGSGDITFCYPDDTTQIPTMIASSDLFTALTGYDSAYFLTGSDGAFIKAKDNGNFYLNGLTDPEVNDYYLAPLDTVFESLCIYKAVYRSEELVDFAIAANQQLLEQGLTSPSFPTSGSLEEFVDFIQGLFVISDNGATINDILSFLESGVACFTNPIGGTVICIDVPELCFDISNVPYCYNLEYCCADVPNINIDVLATFPVFCKEEGVPVCLTGEGIPDGAIIELNLILLSDFGEVLGSVLTDSIVLSDGVNAVDTCFNYFVPDEVCQPYLNIEAVVNTEAIDSCSNSASILDDFFFYLCPKASISDTYLEVCEGDIASVSLIAEILVFGLTSIYDVINLDGTSVDYEVTSISGNSIREYTINIDENELNAGLNEFLLLLSVGSCSEIDTTSLTILYTEPSICNTDCSEIWNPSTCSCDVVETIVEGCTDPFAVNFNPNANCDNGSCLIIDCVINIPMPYAGWHMISSYCHPEEDSITQVFAPIVNDVVQVKNLTGQVYVPSFNNFNTFTTWDVTQGYLVKTANPVTLTINGGDAVNLANDQIPLYEGWNMIAYWLVGDADPIDVFSSVESDVIQVKDLNGAYVPSFNDFNNMGNMTTTKGYQVKMNAPQTLTYSPFDILPRPAPESIQEVERLSPIHFTKSIKPNPNTSTMIIMNDENNPMNYGDEIGVFTPGGILVGAYVYENDMMGGLVFGDDETEEGKDGILENEEYVFKVWDSLLDEEQEVKMQFVEGNATYLKDDLCAVSFKSDGVGLSEVEGLKASISPNPASSELLFDLDLASSEFLTIEIFKVDGQLVDVVAKQSFNNGNTQLVYDVSELNNGLYMCRITNGKEFYTERLTIIK